MIAKPWIHQRRWSSKGIDIERQKYSLGLSAGMLYYDGFACHICEAKMALYLHLYTSFHNAFAPDLNCCGDIFDLCNSTHYILCLILVWCQGLKVLEARVCDHQCTNKLSASCKPLSESAWIIIANTHATTDWWRRHISFIFWAVEEGWQLSWYTFPITPIILFISDFTTARLRQWWR